MESSFLTKHAAAVNLALTAAVLAAIAYAAYANYFIQDDGFISLRYADHWARGYGPVWYPGSREFGYTNFLFMALCALLMALGVGPLMAAGLVSYGGFALAVLAAYMIVLRLTKQPIAAALAILVIFTNFTVSSYASGLMETSLQAGLVLAAYWGVIRYAQEPGTWPAFASALAAALALLTRLDSALLLLPAGLYVLWHLKSRRHLIVFLAVPTVIVGGFLLFCYLLYGHVLPNTFYAKTQGASLTWGITYMKLFLDADNFQYAVFAGALLAVFLATKSRPPGLRLAEAGMLLAATLLWSLYVTLVGGGFMGFRLMVPTTVLFVLAFFILIAPFRLTGLLVCLALYAVATSYSHRQISLETQASYRSFVEPPQQLHGHVARPVINWVDTGRVLNRLFYSGAADDVAISVTAAGALPFHARLPTVDMLGLNDRWVAQQGEPYTERPGHRRIASLAYLKERGVNLIIGHPFYSCAGYRMERTIPLLPMLLIPVGRDCSLLAYYNARHPQIEALIESGAITVQQ